MRVASVFPALAALAAATFLLPGWSEAQPEEIWVVTDGNVLRNFQSTAPSSCTSRTITGLGAGERVVGIDFRPRLPANRLYALTQTGQLYLISNPMTGVATPVGAPVALIRRVLRLRLQPGRGPHPGDQRRRSEPEAPPRHRGARRHRPGPQLCRRRSQQRGQPQRRCRGLHQQHVDAGRRRRSMTSIPIWTSW